MYTKKIYFSGDLNKLQEIFTDVIKVTAGKISAQNVISYVNPAPRNLRRAIWKIFQASKSNLIQKKLTCQLYWTRFLKI